MTLEICSPLLWNMLECCLNLFRKSHTESCSDKRSKAVVLNDQFNQTYRFPILFNTLEQVLHIYCILTNDFINKLVWWIFDLVGWTKAWMCSYIQTFLNISYLKEFSSLLVWSGTLKTISVHLSWMDSHAAYTIFCCNSLCFLTKFS